MTDILLPEQSSILWHTSWYSLLSAMYAVFLGKYECAIVPGSVFLTSVNYWYKPDYSWRRYLDMCVVVTGLTYQAVRAYYAENAVIYYVLTCVGVACYPIAVYYYQQNMLWTSTFVHAGIHVFGNMANIILYSGRVP